MLLYYSLSSARIFFRADKTAKEEQDELKKDGAKPGQWIHLLSFDCTVLVSVIGRLYLVTMTQT